MEAGSLRRTAEGLIIGSTSKGPMNFGASYLEVDSGGCPWLPAKPADQVCTEGRGTASIRQAVVAFSRPSKASRVQIR